MIKSNQISAIIGSLIILGILYFGVLKHSNNPFLYLDPHALVLVVLGTIAVTLVAFPISKLDDIFNFIIFGVYFSKKKKHKDRINLATDMLDILDLNSKNLNVLDKKYFAPYLKEYLSLYKNIDVNSDHLVEILEFKKEAATKKYFDDAKTLLAISKFPPALGLLGASTGMIEMMQQIGGTSGAAGIGRSMATALVATFWGIAIANFVILPLSDSALKLAEEESDNREYAIEFIYFLKNNFPIEHTVEFISSKLSFQERIIFKERLKEKSNLYSAILQKKKNLNSDNDGTVIEVDFLQTKES